MKRIALLSFICLLSGKLIAQSQGLKPFRFNSYKQVIDVLPDGTTFAVTAAGEFAKTDISSGIWTERKIENYRSSMFSGFENVCFFNKDTGFISGAIHTGKAKYPILYTTDGGESWIELSIGMDNPADDAIALREGYAWVSVAGKGIAYTSNFGKHWEKKNIPDVKERFWRIFFNPRGEGLIGSLWNQLWYTRDSCETWTNIQTPLNLKAYRKTSDDTRPEINRVAIFNDYLFVVQQNLCFYSRKDSIDWKLIPGVNDFSTDAYNSALYLIHRNGTIRLWKNDAQQTTIFRSSNSRFTTTCRDGNLYLLDMDSLLTITDQGIKNAVANYTHHHEASTPEIIGYTASGTLGIIGNKIFKNEPDYSNPLNDDWVEWFELPFEVSEGELSVFNNTIRYFIPNSDSAYEYNFVNHNLKGINSRELINSFSIWEVDRIHFSKASTGCFHFDTEAKSYNRVRNSFEESPRQTAGKNVKILDGPEAIDAAEVDQLVKEILANLNGSPTIQDLNLSESDYEKCKMEIEKFQAYINSEKKKKKKPDFLMNENNIDFNLLLAMVDSLKTIDSNRLREALLSLHSSELYSTTTYSTTISLTNLNNTEMTIYYFSSNPVGFWKWWFVEINGVKHIVFSPKISQFIQENGPSGFLDTRPNWKLVADLVRWLYRNI